MNQPQLNPDALLYAVAALHGDNCPDDPEPGQACDCDAGHYERLAETAVSAYLAAALPEVTSKVEAFINQRPEYIHALKNTRSGDDMSDYSRWNGHAESRRQLAQALGWTVPHNTGETTRPEEKP